MTSKQPPYPRSPLFVFCHSADDDRCTGTTQQAAGYLLTKRTFNHCQLSCMVPPHPPRWIPPKNILTSFSLQKFVPPPNLYFRRQQIWQIHQSWERGLMGTRGSFRNAKLTVHWYLVLLGGSWHKGVAATETGTKGNIANQEILCIHCSVRVGCPWLLASQSTELRPRWQTMCHWLPRLLV